MMERMPSVGVAGQVGRFRPEQIAQQSTWTVVPEGQRVIASMKIIHVVPANASTLTYVNPLDPGDDCYYDKPVSWDKVSKAWKM
jgi:hypothetical protein